MATEYVRLNPLSLEPDDEAGALYKKVEYETGHIVYELANETYTNTTRLDDDTVEDVVYTLNLETSEYEETSRAERTDHLYSIDELMNNKLAEIQVAHDAELYTSFTSDALGSPKTYNYSEKAAKRIEQMAAMIGASSAIQEIKWYNVEDGEVVHTRDQFVAVCLAGMAHVDRIERKQIAYDDEIKAAAAVEDREALNAIKWVNG